MRSTLGSRKCRVRFWPIVLPAKYVSYLSEVSVLSPFTNAATRC